MPFALESGSSAPHRRASTARPDDRRTRERRRDARERRHPRPLETLWRAAGPALAALPWRRWPVRPDVRRRLYGGRIPEDGIGRDVTGRGDLRETGWPDVSVPVLSNAIASILPKASTKTLPLKRMSFRAAFDSAERRSAHRGGGCARRCDNQKIMARYTDCARSPSHHGGRDAERDGADHDDLCVAALEPLDKELGGWPIGLGLLH